MPRRWYLKILAWHNHRSPAATARMNANDPLLKLVGSGKHIWADEHADEYVRNLRKDWN